MINRFKKFFQENKYIFFTGGAALFIILFIYFCHSIIPFGEKTIYRMDLYHQYGPLMTELCDRITSGESLIYSWNSGLGSSFIGNFFNYLSSPFSIIVLLFGHENTFEAIATMIAIKAVLSSMAMAYYLKRSQNSNSPIIIAFGIMYAFSGYFIAYYWNVMWIDAMYLLPFIILGIEQIINSGKCKTYIIALALSIYSNYYIGFMLCIFSCVYFLYYYYCSLDNFDKRRKILKYKEDKGNKIQNSFFLNSGIRFALSSFAAALILCGMLIPVAYVLSSSSATSGESINKVSSYFNIFDFFANHLASLKPTIRSSGEDVLPNVYCGLLTIILIPVFFLSKKISLKEKVASITLIVFMFFSFNINIFNLFWHGFHFPNDLPYRQSFMYSFILIIMAHKAFKHIHDLNKKHFVIIGATLISFIIAVQIIGSKNVTLGTVILSIIFVVLLTIVLSLYTSKKNQTYALTILLVCSALAETIVCSTSHYVVNQNKSSFADDYDGFKRIQQDLYEYNHDLFYREELSYSSVRMAPSWYDYNGISVFSSMAYERVANFQKALGLCGNKINSFTYNPNTPIYNSMFSIKYIYDVNNSIRTNSYYNHVTDNTAFKLYENKYHLSLAYPVSSDLTRWNATECSNPVEAQEKYFYFTTGIEDIIVKDYSYDTKIDNLRNIGLYDKALGKFTLSRIHENYDAKLSVEITASKNSNIFIYLHSRHLDEVSINSTIISAKKSFLDGYILDIGKYNIGDKITIEMPLQDDITTANVDFFVFTIDEEKFIQGYEKLKSGQLEISEFTDTKISGTFEADDNEILYTSIPYDKGWKITIDGEEVSKENIISISDALIGVKVGSGKHNITFEFSIPYMNVACAISIVFTLTLVLAYIMYRRKMFIFKNLKDNLWVKSEGELPEPVVEDIIEIDDDYDNNSQDKTTTE